MKNFPTIYKQGDYSDLLGTSLVNTIASGGCFVTSGAIKLGYYGITCNPSDLNKLLIQKSLYLQTDLLPDNWIQQAFSQVSYLKTLDYEPIPTDLGTIATLLNDPNTTLTIRINLGNGNFHFVEAVNCDGTTLHIANPLSGTIEDFSQRYGNPITAKLHVLVYSGVVPVVPPPPPAANTSPVQPDQAVSMTPLAQRFTQAITKSNNFDVVATFLGMSAEQRVMTTAGQSVVDQIKSLQEQVQAFEAAKLPPPIPTIPNTPPTFSNGTSPVAGTGISKLPTPAQTWIQARAQANLAKHDSFWSRLMRTLFL